MSHVVLLGDSVFDNGTYVKPGEPDVLEQVRARLPEGWRVTRMATDGAVTTGVKRQLAQLPEDASHLILSIGGNDALSCSSILAESARSVGEVMSRIADVRDSFSRSYRKMLDVVMSYRLPTVLCTIYDGSFPDRREQRQAATALSVFNDVITREAFGRRLALIDLRLICNRREDYANLIEPSATGGAKIANAIAQAVVTNTTSSQSQVYAQ